MESYLDLGQREPFFTLLSEAETSMKTAADKDSNNAVETYYAVALSLLSYINRWNLMERVAQLIDVNKLMRVDSFNNWDDATKYLHKMSNILFDIREDMQKNQDNIAVNFIKDYIEQHLGEDLSLARLAELVHLNASYLSRLFKQTTGIKLSEHIEYVRIQKAKELLLKGDKKIKDVAKLVGYDAAASFIRFFKKSTGYSPQEYRKHK